MKNFLLLTLLWIGCAQVARAQLPNGSIAPDWTLVDLDGNTHHLYDYLDQGYTVYIDMFATWCGPCWNYHNTHILKNLYEQYGPDGTDQVMVFGIESDLSTPTNCIYDIDCPSSQGDWTAGVPYPIIDITATNGPTMPSEYQLAYYPTIYAICPLRTITEVGQVPLSNLVNFLNNCPAPPPLAFSYTSVDISCTLAPEGSIDLNVTGGKAPYTYQWSNGSTSQDLSNISVGVYSCIITDAKGESITTPGIVIDGPSSLVTIAYQTQENTTCEQSNGMASVVVQGGDPGYTYLWSNGANSQTITGIFAGYYSVQVFDSEGCTTSTDFVIYNTPSPEVVLSASGELSCSQPQIEISSAGSSTGPQYSYSWTTSNGHILTDPLLQNITVGAAGLYVLTIFDSQLGCYNANFIQINGTGGLPNANAGSDKFLPCGGGQTTLNGSGSSSGNHYTYHWTTTDGNILGDPTELIIQVDAAGTYVLAVTNTNNGCTAQDQTEVTVDDLSSEIEASLTPITCHGEADGSIAITDDDYNFTWSNGATTSTVTGLSTGNYTVTITSNSGCTAVENYSITQPAVLSGSYAAVDASSESSHDGSATATAAGGTAPYSYSWSTGATTATITGLVSGVYYVTIQDANQCVTAGAVVVNVHGCIMSVGAVVENVRCYAESTGSISLELNDVSGSATISWSHGDSAATISGLAAGTYSAIVQDGAGCFFAVNEQITQGVEIILDMTVSEGPQCPQDPTGFIEIQASGGDGTLTYLWSNGATTPEINGLIAGVYAVSITDEAGCTTIKDLTLKSKDTEKPELNLKTAVYQLNSDGLAHIDFANIDNGSSDNCSAFSIDLDPAVLDCSEIGFRDIIVTMTDASGNVTTATTRVEIIDDSAPVWHDCPTTLVLANSCNGLASVDLSFSDNCDATTIQQISGIAIDAPVNSGTYQQKYVLTDVSGNISVCEFMLRRDPAMQADYTALAGTCEAMGKISTNVNYGSAPYQYAWSNGNITAESDVQPGAYTITVTDASGCEQILDVSVDGVMYYEVVNAVLQADDGSQNGSITIEMNAPVDNLTFEWTQNGIVVAHTQNLDQLSNGIYTLIITSTDGCEYGPYVYEITGLSVNDRRLNKQISIFPNPAGDRIQITYEGNRTTFNVVVFDNLGSKMMQGQIELSGHAVHFSTDMFPDGVYHLLLTDGNRHTVKRVVVMRK